MLTTTGSTRSPQFRTKQLPVELIFEIITMLTPEDSDDPPEDVRLEPQFERKFRALVVASQVSRTWLEICRRKMFDRVCISTKNPNARLAFLHFEAPHLTKYIRKLHLWWNNTGSSCTASEWFPDCFAQLTNLSELHVEFQEPLELSKAPAPLSAGIVTMLPSLRKLVLCRWKFALDATDLLSILPHTLEELLLEEISTTDSTTDPTADMEAKPPSTIRLEALRTLVLINICHPLLKFKDFIESPNLKRFSAEWPQEDHWEMPEWIPASIAELTLTTDFGGDIPVLPSSIQPSAVTIELAGDNTYHDLFRWVEACIRRFPSPKLIRALNINIVNDHILADYPRVEECHPCVCSYEQISQFLKMLHRDGILEAITLKMTMQVDEADVDLYLYSARESRKLKIGFAPLLEANVLDVSFEVERWCIIDGAYTTPERIMCCSVGRK